VLAAGVSFAGRDGARGHSSRDGPGALHVWDLVGVVDRLGAGISGIEPGQVVAAMPISGAYPEFVCLAQRELVPVSSGLDPAEAVSIILNYITI
jgi:NADPH:quinone reductase-like Zn-dependent oxidoreductase